MVSDLRRRGVLLLILALYALLTLLCSTLAVTPALYGLSTVLGTTVLGTTVLGTTVLGSTLLGTTSLVKAYTEAMALGQFAIGLTAIGLLIFLELSDPSFGEPGKLVRDLRRSWLPVVAVLMLLFAIIVVFRIAAVLG